MTSGGHATRPTKKNEKLAFVSLEFIQHTLSLFRSYAETVPAGTQKLEDVGVIRERSSIAEDCDQFPETILDGRGFGATQSSIGVGGWRLPDTVGSGGHTVGERHTVLNSTPDRSDICVHDHKRFRCRKPTSEWHMVSQESPTTVEVDRHTIHPC